MRKYGETFLWSLHLFIDANPYTVPQKLEAVQPVPRIKVFPFFLFIVSNVIHVVIQTDTKTIWILNSKCKRMMNLVIGIQHHLKIQTHMNIYANG